MQPQFLFYAAALVVGAVLFEAREQPPLVSDQEPVVPASDKLIPSSPAGDTPQGQAEAGQEKSSASKEESPRTQNAEAPEPESQQSDAFSEDVDGSDTVHEVPERPLTPEEIAAQEEIHKLGEKFVQGYEKGDYASLGALFTDDAEYVNENGEVVQGKEEIEASLKEFFTAHPECRLEVVVESVRFPGPSIAVEDGATRVTHVHQSARLESTSQANATAPSDSGTSSSGKEAVTSPGAADSPEPSKESNGAVANSDNSDAADGAFGTQVECRYTAVYVAAGGEWRIASIRDFPHENRREHHARLEELEWLTGDWLDEGGDSVIHFSCRPSENGHFLLRDFTIVIGGQESMRGTQRIGWDPIARKLRAWIFDSDGGFADGFWYQNGDEWVLKCNGVTADGESASGSMIYTSVSDHIMHWQMVDHEVNGLPMPDSEVFTIVRTAPSPAPELAEDSK